MKLKKVMEQGLYHVNNSSLMWDANLFLRFFFITSINSHCLQNFFSLSVFHDTDTLRWKYCKSVPLKYIQNLKLFKSHFVLVCKQSAFMSCGRREKTSFATIEVLFQKSEWNRNFFNCLQAYWCVAGVQVQMRETETLQWP